MVYYYKNCFNAWCAVFIDDQDNEYHLQIDLDAWAWQDNYKYGKSVTILKQCSNHRIEIAGPFKTIKAGLECLEKILYRKEVSAL